MPSDTSTDIVAHCTSSALELQHHVQRYDDLLDDYRQTGEQYDELQEAIEDVGEAWKEVDSYKDELDTVIASLEIEVDNDEASWYVDDVEGLLHTTISVDDATEAAEVQEMDGYDDIEDDIAAAALQADYEDLATFNKLYVESLATIAQHEQEVREDDDLTASPEQIRMDGDEDYTTLEERIRQQIEILEQAKERF